MSAAVLHHQQNRILRRFHQAGATDRDSAKPLSVIGVRRSLVFRYLARRGVIRTADSDLYFLDEVSEHAFRRHRFRFAVVVMVVGLLVLAGVLAIAVLSR